MSETTNVPTAMIPAHVICPDHPDWAIVVDIPSFGIAVCTCSHCQRGLFDGNRELTADITIDPKDALIARLRSELAACHKTINDALAHLADENEYLAILKATQILNGTARPAIEDEK